jgi:hypothetical protein
MASNRAIMPRADSTSCTVGRSDEGLPSPRTNFQTMLKVTLILGQGRGAAASTARFCCSSRDALVLCIKCGHLPRTYQRRLRIPPESPHQPFPQREMAFNNYTSFAVWASKVVRGTKSFAGLLKFPGVNDP